MGQEHNFDVFLSHNSKDKAAVRKLKQRLEADRIKVWFDERELLAGDELHKAIAEGLDQSRVCAVFIGSEGFGPWHDWEIGIAVNMHVNSPAFRLIPVILPRESKSKFLPSEVPLWLRGLLWVEFPRLDDDEQYQRLKDGILGRGSDLTPRAIRQIEEDAETNITPRGLRSFEEDDKHFFLRLVAGPRDHRGLPVSIAFWKNRLEQVDPDKTFRVGLLFGPSGCGKSSLVKAGLLPRLHQYVKPIYLAATPDRTEQQLLNAVRKQVPELPSDLGLVESLSHLTSHPDVLKDFKLVIVLDQFEQWLHSKVFNADTKLIAALRHCDAANLQAVVMVRADFYVETHRLFEQLDGVKIQDDINADLIDLFDRDHARNVLLEYGRAYGRFTDPQSLNVEEETFLAETLDQLQDSDQRLVAVQLALFADLMKNKLWTGAVLKKLGGATGVGRAFLEENFDAKTANATHRFHRKAAVAVLKELLPPPGAGIKGTSKTKSELMQAASYQSRPADFEGVLGVLLNDLKLISPVACEEDSSSTESSAVDPRYQLSHDYLVPSLRDWLTSKDRETCSGRARLVLVERHEQWQRDQQTRYLPTTTELCRIELLVPRRDRTEPQRKMLRAARRRVAWNTANTVLVFFVLASPLWVRKLIDFFTFQAEFAVRAYEAQRVEVVITRKFNPFGFQMGTGIFEDKLAGVEAKNCINQRMSLPRGLFPDWRPLASLLNDNGLAVAEVEWLDRPITSPRQVLNNDFRVIPWGRASPAVIEALVALHKSENRFDRASAAESLVPLGMSDAMVIGTLIERLKDGNFMDRSQAASALGKLGKSDVTVTESLFTYLNDPNPSVASSVEESLVQLGKNDAAVIKTLVALTKDQDSDVRKRLAQFFAKLGQSNVAAHKALGAFLKDKDNYVCIIAAESLHKLGKSDAAVIEALVTRLTNPSSNVRCIAATALAQMGKNDATVFEVLLTLLKDQDDYVRVRAAKSLAEFGETEALLALLKDRNSSIRSSAAESLAKLGRSDTAVVEELVALCKDPFLSVRVRATTVLAKLGECNAAVIETLFELLKSQDKYGSSSAAAALVQLGRSDAAVKEALIAHVKNPDTDICASAAEFLGLLGRSDAAVVEALIPLLKHEDWNVQRSAIASLVQLGKSDATVKEALITLARNPDKDVCCRAAKSLGLMGKSDAAVIEALVPLLKHQDWSVRSTAAFSLGQLGNSNKAVIDGLVELLKTDFNDYHSYEVRSSVMAAFKQLGKSDEAVIKALVAFLKNGDILARERAAESLGQLSQKREDWTDERMMADFTNYDSGIRELAGIVLAYRRQKVDSELTSEVRQYLQGIRDQVERLRKDPRPWVKQASLHALYHIEKRKAELEEEARKTAEEKAAATE